MPEKKTSDHEPTRDDLRRRAEERYEGRSADAAPSPADTATLLHELGVRQIELEMQNEELRRAQLELEAQRARYFELFDLAPVGYCTLSDKGIVGDANLTAARLLGVERQELVGQPFSASILAADQDAYYRNHRLLVQTGEPQSCELRLQRAGAEPFWAHIESQPQGAGDDERLSCRLTFTDITERKRVERQSKERVKELQALYGLAEITAREGLTLGDLCQEFTDILPKSWQYPQVACARTVIGDREFRTNNFAESAWMQSATVNVSGSAGGRIEVGYLEEMPEEDEGPFLKEERWLIDALAQRLGAITAGKREHEELEYHRRHLEELVAARTEEIGAANLVLEERGAEVARWRQNFDAFFNTIDDLLFVLDVQGNMMHVNETVCRRLGYAEEELVGRPVLDVHPPARREEAGAIVAAMLAGDAAFCPVPVVTRDGEQIPVETRVVAGVWDGEPALFGVTKDVSALNLSEERFQRLFHGNPALMAVSSLPDRRFIEVNDAFLSTLGYSSEEILGHTSEELGLFVEPERQRAVAEQLQAHGSARDSGLKVRRRDGAVIDGLFSGEIIESQGQRYFLTVMIDQTERKQAEEALQQSEEQLACAVEGSGVGLWDWYVQTGEETFNERWAEIAGYTLAELAPTSIETWRRLTHPEDLQRADELLEEHFRGHTAICSFEERVRHKDGHWVWVLDRGKVSEWDDEGRPVRMTGTALDITERREMEERLRESEEQLARAVEGSGAGLWDWNIQTGETTFNERWTEIAGYTLDELAPLSVDTWRGLCHPDDLRRSDDLIKRHLDGTSPMYECELRVRHRDGHWVWIVDRGKVSEWDADGRPLRMTGTHLDVSTRKEAEEALRMRESYLSAIIENQPGLVWLKDTESRFLAVNRAFVESCGRQRADEVVGKTDLDIWPRELAEAYRADDVRVMESGRPVVVEEPIADKGETRWFETFKTPVADEQGEVIGTTGYARDITERRLAEERLRRVNRQLEQAVEHANDLVVDAQAATSAKSRFMAHMSHEIRTPLNAIIGFAQLLRQDPDLTPQQADRVATINRSGEHLLALLSDVLHLSKAEARVQRLDRGCFDLHELLEDLALVFGVRADAKGLAFSCAGIGEVPRYVTGDQLKLRQTLTNLLANAVNFTDGGHVALRVLASPREEAGGSRLVALVEDSGPGIAADEMSVLFVPFEQTASGRASGSGTGLGLAISRQFAQIMGGELTATSRVGEGSVFRLEIPLEAGTAGMAARSEVRRVVRLAADQPPCSVLVVDDDEDSRTILRDLLGAAGFDVRAVAGGLEAVEVFESLRPSLVLMDLWMPDVDGNEATRLIRATEAGAGARIVALTANVSDGVRSNALAAGADAFMTKPFQAEAIFEQIRLLTGVRYVYAETAAPAADVEEAPALRNERLLALPEALKRQLRDAAVRARHARLLELADEVAAVDPEAGAALKKVVGGFDYAAVLRALEEDGA